MGRKPSTVDEYLASIPNPQRKTLQALRKTMRKLLPQAEECISYNIPAFRVDGKVIGGFAGFQDHCSYFPFSGRVVDELKPSLQAYECEKGTIRFPAGKPVPASLVKKLIVAHLNLISRESAAKGRARNYYDNGILQSSGRLKGGRMHGKWEWFRRDGSKMRSGEFNMDAQTGVWRTYDRKGRVVKETKFSK